MGPMSFLPQFFAPMSALLFLLTIPLIIFYFLKLKRPQQEIPSLALWRQVINDQRVNSPFQKFKRNILLLLQLLMLALLVLAAMQPFLQADAERAEFLPILIDCSASMAAVDQPGGRSRLDLAKQQVGEIIDNLLPDQRLSLIAVHSTARRLTDFTNNKRVLREALAGIEVAQVPSQYEDALRMTQALSRTKTIKTVVIYTDGNIPHEIDFELPFELNFQKLPAGGTNIGVTAFNARRARGSSWDVFVRIEGTQVQEGKPQRRENAATTQAPAATTSQRGQAGASVELLQDGQVVAQEFVLLENGASQRLVFGIETEGASSLEVRLKPEGFDSLAIDNAAFLNLPAGRPLATYCHLELGSYRRALKPHEKVVVYPEAEGGDSPSSFDLLITDRLEDAAREATVSLFVGVVPEDLKSLVSVTTGFAEVVDWHRTDPLLQHVQLLGVQIADEPRTPTEVQAAEFEELGYEILAQGRTGPLVLKKRTGEKVAYYLLFHTDRSTLPYRVGFPILVANAVQIALHESDLAEVRSQPTGVLPEKTLEPEQRYTVTDPGGGRHDVETDSKGILAGVPAPYAGRYVIRSGEKTEAAIGISLLSAQETSLAAVSDIQFRELKVSLTQELIESDWPLWPLLASLAFGVLLVEWWYFQKRPGGVPV